MAFSFGNFLKGFGQGFLGSVTGGIIPAVGSVAGAKVSSDAANKAAAVQKAAADAAASGVTKAGADAQAGMRDASGKAIAGMDSATHDANGVLSNIYSDVKGGIQPYLDAGTKAVGTLSALTAPGGEFSQKFTADNFKDLDPGFDFRLQQATKALDRSAAAKGGALSGGSLRSLTRYSQGMAEDDFGKAFDRFETQKNDRFNQLSNVANFGQNANGQMISAGSQFGVPQSQNLINDARYAGDTGVTASGYIGNTGLKAAEDAGEFGTQGANAAASGYLGSAKAVNSGIGGVANAAQNLFLSSVLNKKPKPAVPNNYSSGYQYV